LEPSSQLVVDANVAIWAVLPFVSTVDVVDRFASWHGNSVRLVAPMLWLAECASAIHGLAHIQKISIDRARVALDDALGLGIELLPMTGPQVRLRMGRATGAASRQ
jgi:predicted nucleic acid-binding protein